MHTNVFHRFGLLAILTALLTGCDEHAADRAAVKATFDNWARCNVNADGDGAAKLFSSNTLKHYEDVLKSALDGSSDDVAKLEPVDLREVVLMRNRATRKQLEKLDGKGYAKFSCGSGWYADDEEGRGLINVKITGDNAQGEMDAEDVRWKVRFVREGGAWKLDETSVHPYMSQAYREEARASGQSLRDYMISMEEEQTGKPVSPSIWKPMKK